MSGWELFDPPKPLLPTLKAGSWQDDPTSPLRQRRRKPSGGFEYRPKPGAMGDAPAAVGPPDDPYAGRHGAAVLAEQVVGRAADQVLGIGDLYLAGERLLKDSASALRDKAVEPFRQTAPQADRFGEEEYDYATAKALGLKPDETGHWPSRVPSGPMEGLILKSRNHPTFGKTVIGEMNAGYKIIERDGRLWSVPAVADEDGLSRGMAALAPIRDEPREKLRESLTAKGASPLATALADTAVEAIPTAALAVVDPTNLDSLATAAGTVSRETSQAFRALGESARLAPEAGAIRMPEWFRRFTGQADAEAAEEAARARARLTVSAARERRAPLPEGPRTPLPEPPPGIKPGDPWIDAAARERLGLPSMRRGAAPEPRSMPEPPSPAALPEIGAPRGGEAPIEAARKLSTKGITNVAGMQPELQEIARDNIDLIYAARGEPRSVSIYHDAKSLADQTGMTLEGFLDSPAGRTWNDREVALGKSILGGLRQRMKATAERVGTGELDIEAAKTLIAEDRLKIAKLMATLQGQGASEWGRGLRSLQEAVDPFGIAETPAEQLQLSLMKRYKDQLRGGVGLSPEAAKLEQRAIASMKRQAGYATRKAKRAATGEELAAEFSGLAEELNRLSRRSRPHAVIPGDMLAVVGRMAQNRVKAGVNNVAQIADEIYQVVRAHVDDITLEDVRGLVVEQALQKPGKKSGARTAAQSTMEQGIAKRYRDQLDDDVMQKISMLGDDPESPDLLNFLRQMEQPHFRDYAGAYWINSILSGPKTLVRNGVGNAVRLAELTVFRPADILAEKGLALLQGRPAERSFREVVPSLVGEFAGLPEGIRKFAFVMRKGYSPDRLIEDLTGSGSKKFEAGGRLILDPFVLSQSRGVRTAGAALTLPSRLLSATDALFRTMAHSSELYASAARTAAKEGLSGPAFSARAAELLANPTPEMMASAQRFAQKATYTDPMSAIGRLAVQGREVMGPAGDHLLPFVHVSDRVAAAVTDYIPGIKPRKLRRLLKEQSPEAAELIARQAAGVAIGMMGFSWASQGKLVGAAPQDEKLRNDFYAEGKQPYSVLIAGRWVPIRDIAGPFAGPLVAAIALHDHLKDDPTGSKVDEILHATGGMALSSASYLLDASYLQTLQDLASSVQEQRGDLGKGAVEAGARVAGGYLPFSGAQRSVATFRDPRVVEKAGPVEEIQAGVPGLREKLPPRLDVLGNPLTISTGKAGALSPIVPTESKIADPALAEEVGRLRYTVTNRARELGKLQKQLANAQKTPGQEARAEEILASLPPLDDPEGLLRAALDSVRDLEDQIRRLRVDPSVSPADRRELEIGYQQEIRRRLQDALAGLSPGAAATPMTNGGDEWDSLFGPPPQ